MKTVHFIFPHQLFKSTVDIALDATVMLVEEFLFFKQYKFHKQKLVFHRASMKAYQHYLMGKGFSCQYVNSTSPKSDIRALIKDCKEHGYEQIAYAEVCDDWLQQRITKSAAEHEIGILRSASQLFINTPADLSRYFENKRSYFQTDFYIDQRKRRNILIENNKPLQGKWSFDTENRVKYPKDKVPPIPLSIKENRFYQEAVSYVNQNFQNHYGEISSDFIYPSTFDEAEAWLKNFFESRFADFGIYEDAIIENESLLHHSLLTPLLNTGLLLPLQVIDDAITCAIENGIPYNSLEGFVRQILGWREFIRALYVREGRKQRTTNYWGFERKIPASFYNATTGITPIDATIKKLLKTGYTHHIERLMILSNFMLLCEFHPDDVYQWFMEMYIDAYDWVMVPNVYGMGQFADGGLMCTKPYISGSNYVLKMSNYKKKEPWAEIWDSLFWRFMHVNRDFFLKNPRLGMLIKTFDKMEDKKRKALLKRAEYFLETLQ